MIVLISLMAKTIIPFSFTAQFNTISCSLKHSFLASSEIGLFDDKKSYILKKKIHDSIQIKNDRLNAVTRATSLVQILAQPSSGVASTMVSQGTRLIMRATPSFLKQPSFNAMMRYSIGLPPL